MSVRLTEARLFGMCGYDVLDTNDASTSDDGKLE